MLIDTIFVRLFIPNFPSPLPLIKKSHISNLTEGSKEAEGTTLMYIRPHISVV